MIERSEELRQELRLIPHPEGGHYREIYRSDTKLQHPRGQGERSSLTMIYFLLQRGDFSALHEVLSDEAWVILEGGLELHLISPEGKQREEHLAPVAKETEPCFVVPAGWLQAARPAERSEYALCMCLVAPGFDFADFSMPSRAELLQRFPTLAGLIEDLTRE